MKAHTNEFKNMLTSFGREFDYKITYNNQTLPLEDIRSVNYYVRGNLLKTSMKEIQLDSKTLISKGTTLNYQIGLKTRSGKNLFGFFASDWYNDTNVTHTIINVSALQVETNGSNSYANSKFKINLADGTYTFSLGKVTNSNSNYTTKRMTLSTYTNGSSRTVIKHIDAGTPETITITNESNKQYVLEFWASYSSAIINTSIFENVQIEKGSTATSYEEYGTHEYMNMGNYIVEKIEEQKDSKSYLLTCYDKMLLTMIDYKDLSEYELTADTEFEENKTYYQLSGSEYVEYDGERTGNPNTLGLYELTSIYPITIRNYLSKICSYLGINFASSSDTFVNYNKEIPSELYLDSEGNSLGYTFRDVLDEIAQVTGSFICINENDALEVRYISRAIGGKNLYNYKNTVNVTSGITVDDEGWITISYNNSSGSSTKYMNYFTHNLDLETSTKYTIITEVKSVSGTGRLVVLSRTDGGAGQFDINYNLEFATDVSNNGVYTTQKTTRSSYAYDNGLRTFVQFLSGQSGSITFRISVVKDLTITPQNFVYDTYYDTIDENFFNDTNVNIGKKYGPINSVVFSRSADSDNIYRSNNTSITNNGLCELKIVDNQILNSNNRSDFADALFTYLDGIYYYLNDFDTKGIVYYELGDMYNVSIFGNSYQCLLLNDEIDKSGSLKESIYTDEPDPSETDYKASDTTDKKINQAYLIVNKQEGTITGLVSKTNIMDTTINNNYQELNSKFDGYTPVSRTVEIENSVTTLQTDTYTKTEIDTKLVDGSVEKVMTASGTFDIDGMHYEKSNANTSTTINEVGVGVKKTDGSNDYILFAGYVDSSNTQYSDFEGQTIVASENMLVDHYFVIGDRSRMENYENGTGMFYIGG